MITTTTSERKIDYKSYTIDQLVDTIPLSTTLMYQSTKEDIDKAYDYTGRKFDKSVRLGENLGDRKKWIKRNVGGCLAEIGVENIFGIKFIDLTIGCEGKYKGPDMGPAGHDCGIKTSTITGELRNVALTKFYSTYPELITSLIHSNFDYEFGDKVLIQGIASIENLRRYTDRKFVRSSSVPDYKGGYYGYHVLGPINNYNEFVLSL